MTNLPARSTVVAPAGALSSATGPSQRIRPSSIVTRSSVPLDGPFLVIVKPVNTTVSVVVRCASWQDAGRPRSTTAAGEESERFCCSRHGFPFSAGGPVKSLRMRACPTSSDRWLRVG